MPPAEEAADFPCTAQAPAMEPADILGLSCRFPESSSASEFWSHLTQGDDMVTSDDRRWPVGLHGTPPRSGKVPDFEKFDASFFSVHGKQAQKMDPQMRKLLEVSWEAWTDSGVDVNKLRGSDRVGVYIGCCGSEVHAAWLADVPNITGYEQTGCTQSMFANRLSWTYDFRGPSKAVDTACSSSALALHDALADLTAGRCDYAMVGGASSILRPATSVAFNKLHMLSPDGSCKSFSAAANGYTRADGIAMLILRRSNVSYTPQWSAREPYAQVINIGTNNDGHTKEGITFPSSDAQGALARQVCGTAGVDPIQIGYIEAHGTGTVAGDGQELAAIDAWYGRAAGRTPESPLLIGSVKSNMGHCEGASGLAGVIKLCLSYEHGMLPGNLHYTEPNPNCASLHEGILKVVDACTPWEGGYAALSSFGFGGSNVHLLLHGRTSSHSRAISQCASNLIGSTPLSFGSSVQGLAPENNDEPGDLIPLATRTQEGMTKLVAAVKEARPSPTDVVMPLRRFANTLGSEMGKFSCRGTLAAGEVRSAMAPSTAPQVWFVFSGNGSQWSTMGLSLLQNHTIFRRSVQNSAACVSTLGIDLLAEFQAEAGFKESTRSALGLCAVQIALVDVLREELGILPDGMLGHSAGEIACGYASGCLTREQTLLVAFHRGRLPGANGLTGGLMAATGLSAAEALARIEGTSCVLACDNSPSSTTLSGPAADLRCILAGLQAEGVFVREIDTLGLAFHSPALDPLLPDLKQELLKAIPAPKERPSSWLSTSFAADSSDPASRLCSAEYQVHSYRNRVLFKAAAQAVPKDAVLVEIGPHAILRSPLRQSRPDLSYISLMRKGECGRATLMAAVGDLWRKGVPVKWQTDEVPDGIQGAELPRSIREALASWDHKVDYQMPKMSAGSGTGAFSKTYELGGEHAFLADHKIDGRILMPATSYLVTAWEALAAQMGKPMGDIPVEWSDIIIHQAVQADAESSVTLSVLLDRSHRFQVLSGTDLIAEGKIKALPISVKRKTEENREQPKAIIEDQQASVQQPEWHLGPLATIEADAFYRDVGRTGISYGSCFRMVQKASTDGMVAFMRWDNCFIRFLDGMLQSSALGSTDYQLRIPVRLRHVAILEASPRISTGDSVRVDVDPLCGTASTPICEVAGVELSVAPVRPPNSRTVVSRIAWVPYGDRISEDLERQQYAGQLCALAKTLLLPKIEAMESLPVHLIKAKDFLSRLSCQLLTKKEQDSLLERQQNKLAELIMEAAASANNALEGEFAALPEESSLAAAFESDPLLTGFGLPELKIMLDIAMENQRPEGFRACEVGAGSCAFTKQAVSEMASNPVTDLLQYIVTDKADISANVAKAVPSPKVACQVWDINEAAPTSLGAPFDVILASHALHNAKELPRTLANLAAALSPGGFLLVQELTSQLAPCLLDLAAPAWECTDAREFGKWTGFHHWQQLLETAGFAVVSSIRCPDHSSATFLVRKVETRLVPATPFAAAPLEASDEDMDAWLASYQTALDATESALEAAAQDVLGASKLLASQEGEALRGKVWIHGDTVTTPGLLGFVRSAKKEPKGDLLRCIFSVGKTTSTPTSLIEACRSTDLLMNVFVEGRNGSYRSILTEHALGMGSNELPNGCHLEFASYGDLSSLTWVENEHIPASVSRSLVQCDVSYGALNFRDVMLAYGKLSRELMAHSKGGDYIGLEFSGTATDNGKRVMGVAQHAIATKVSTPAYLLWDVPAGWSLAEAATVPVAYATAYYALVLRGRLRSQSSVLIHSGSGAVGLAAIQICLSRGCQVFTTCGSAAKRQFLLNAFPSLKQEQIGDSRSCSFEGLVMRATQGRGVHLILNSLADDKLQASVRCLGSRGRLLEIGKYDILRGTALSMRPLLRNIAFDGIDLDRVFNDAEDTTEVEALHDLMQQGIASGEVRPLPLNTFKRDAAEEAFRYMATGTHIGKCMIEMQPDCETASYNCLGPERDASPACSTRSDQQLQQPSPTTRPTFTCREDRCYVLTGGLGGFGLALASWLVQRGARHLLLSSRRGIRTGAQAKAIQQLKDQGAQVEISQLDVSLFADTQQMLHIAEQMAPVAGIFHLAMVLTDKWLANQTGEGWNKGVIPKAVGGRNLDAASRQLTNLEHFVMFSSIVASSGNEGQSNYGYANSALDFLCEERSRQGLPALSVQWGVIGNVGFVEESMQGKLIGRLSEISLPQPVDDCLKILGRLLCGGPTHGPVMGSFWQPADLLGCSNIDSDKDLVTAILDVMGLSADAVNDNDSLAAMGIDSMQLVEVRATVQRALGRPLPLEEIGTLTIGGLKALAADAGSAAPAAVSVPPPQPAAPELSSVRASREPSRPTTPVPGTPDQGESPRASDSSCKAMAPEGKASLSQVPEQLAASKQRAHIQISASSKAEHQPEPVPEIVPSSEKEDRYRRLAWSVMSGAGMLLIGVMLYGVALPAFSSATALAESIGLVAAMPLLPLLWLLLGGILCLATVAVKRLCMPALSEDRPIALFSADFACWWLVHRAISMTNHLFARHLRGTPFLPAFLRALGAQIGNEAYIDSLDFMDLDLVRIGGEVAIGEGATILAHSFRDGLLHFSKVSIGDGCQAKPYSIVAAGTQLPAGATLGPLETKPAKECSSKTSTVSAELTAAMANVVASAHLSPAASACLQVAGLYFVGLTVTLSAFAGYLILACAMLHTGMSFSLAFQPAAFALSAMVAMASPLYLAFLPLMLPMQDCIASCAFIQFAAAIAALPMVLGICGVCILLLSALAKKLIIGRVPAGVFRRNTIVGIQFWLTQRLVDTAYAAVGSSLMGTWGASTFYRLFGAKVGKWTTFRFGNTILAPDMLDIGDWVHVGDTANVVTAVALDNQHVLTAPVVLRAQALLGVSSVLLPGTVVGLGATLGALASPPMGSCMQPGLVHVGHPATPIMKAAPGSAAGDTPSAPGMRLLVAVFPVLQLAAALSFTALSLAPAAATAHLFGSVFPSWLAAAAVTAVFATSLAILGAAAKRLLVGRLHEAAGIEKYSRQNLGRMLAWVVEMTANSLFGEAARGSSFWNGVLRSRGVAVGRDVYIDTLWAGDFELMSYGDRAVVDRGAVLFAHLGMFREGRLRMMQQAVALASDAVVEARASVLPGFRLGDGQILACGQLGMKL